MDHPGVRRLSPGPDGIVIIASRQCRKVHDEVSGLINQLGLASSRAQGLSHIITTYSSFAGSDMKLYILTTDGGKKALGFVKVGVRNLFLWDRKGVQHEKKLLCLLDFFTVQTCQRKGYGKKMIDAMLEDCGLQMKQMPIDRPSSLCLSFMKKHFGLSSFLPQANNYVVFDEFWGEEPAHEPKEANSGARTPTGHVTFASKATAPRGAVLQAIITNPAKKSHFNPVTWSLHPGVDQ
jgi:alpha-tubulin N-acetyltransferase 1